MPEGNQLFRQQHSQWCCELEITLRAAADEGDSRVYQPSLCFSRPNDNGESRMPNAPPIVIDYKLLAEQKGDPIAYGKALWVMLFDGTHMRRALEKANTNAKALNLALRLRLRIDHDALELHSIWWETLVDPDTDSPMLMRQDIVFSRYLTSLVNAPAEPQSARKLRVLYAVANPGDIEEFEVNGRVLGKPDPGSQLTQHDLADWFDVVMLGEGAPVTLDSLIAQLRRGFDILYLVSHGALVGNHARLYLEDDSRMTKAVPGELLVARLREMVTQPSLILLASCQSAGTGAATSVGDDGELAALGPRLMDAGVGSVIAMQGNISQRTVRRFMPALLREIAAHGRIEQAIAVARSAVSGHPDWWIPVLYMRLKSGALWNPPVTDVRSPEFDWNGLIEDLKVEKTVMVLGSGLGEEVLGATREIAHHWVTAYKYPMTLQVREGLPQVTQYLACIYNRDFTLAQLRRYLLFSLRVRYAGLLAEYQENAGAPDELDALIREIGKKLRAQIEDQRKHGQPDAADLAYTRIARLPVTTYVTTNRDNLLLDSLKAEGREPEVVICRWKPMVTDSATDEGQAWPSSIFDREPGFKPTYLKPLIYHVFGSMSHPHTVVLTEDDYFDFLVGFSRNQGNACTSMPAHIKMVLAAHGLVFLGFQFNDWEFRTMFRGVLPREGIEAGDERSNVAVQVAQDDTLVHSPERARDYMNAYYSQNRKIQVFWGDHDKFLAELTERWKWTTQ